jgi:hypothetical protein
MRAEEVSDFVPKKPADVVANRRFRRHERGYIAHKVASAMNGHCVEGLIDFLRPVRFSTGMHVYPFFGREAARVIYRPHSTPKGNPSSIVGWEKIKDFAIG